MSPNFTDNNSTDLGFLGQKYSTVAIVILAFVMLVLSLVTIVGNFMVILAFYIDRSLRIPSNYFILSLGVSDLLIGLEGFPIFTVYVIQKQWTMGWFMCDLWLSIDYVVCLASIYTVLMITIDRFCSVRLAAAYRNWRTQSKVEVMIVIVWLIPTILFFLTIFGWSTFVGERTVPNNQCYVQFMTNPYFNMSMYIAYYWSTLVVMLILYAGIYQSAQRLQRKAAKKQQKLSEALQVRRSLKKRDPTQMLDTGNSLEHIPATPLRQSSESSESSLYIAEQQRLRRLSAERHSVSATHRMSIHNLASVIKVKQKWLHLPRRSHVDIRQDIGNHLSPFLPEGNSSPRCNRSHSLMPEAAKKGSLAYKPTQENSKTQPALRVSIPTVSSQQPRFSDPSSLITAFTEGTTLALEETILVSSEVKENEKSITFDLSHAAVDYTMFRSASPHFDPFEVFAHSDLSDLSFIDEDDEETTQASESLSPQVHKSVSKHISPGDPGYELPQFVVETISSEQPTECTQEGESSTAPLTHGKFRKKQSSGSKTSKSSRHLDPEKGSSQSRKFSIKKVALQLRRVSKKVGGNTENRARKALRTITIILGAFIFFWTPFYVVATVYGFCPLCVPIWLYEASYYMCYLNSPINPFCYALANTQFKRAFVRILKGDIKRYN